VLNYCGIYCITAANAVNGEATGGRAHNLDGGSESYNGGSRHARFANAKVNAHCNAACIVNMLKPLFSSFLVEVERGLCLRQRRPDFNAIKLRWQRQRIGVVPLEGIGRRRVGDEQGAPFHKIRGPLHRVVGSNDGVGHTQCELAIAPANSWNHGQD